MTKYRVDRIDRVRVDRIITGAYTGPLAKRHCADEGGDDVTECTGRGNYALDAVFSQTRAHLQCQRIIITSTHHWGRAMW